MPGWASAAGGIASGLIRGFGASKQNYKNRVHNWQMLHANRVNYINDRTHAEAREDHKERTHFTRMRDAAARAGINPLTAMRGTTGMGGGVSFGPMGAQQSSLPVLSSADGFADAVGTAVDTLFNGKQRQIDAEREALQTEIMREELKTLQNNNNNIRKRNFGYSIPHVVQETGLHDERSGKAGASGKADNSSFPVGGAGPLPNSGPDSFNKLEAPRATILGKDFYGSGRMSSGQTFEDAVGEGPVSWLNSVGVMLDMLGYTAGKALQEPIDKYRLKQIYRQVRKAKRPKTPTLTQQRKTRQRYYRNRHVQ